jgi:hypothetical protein
VKSGVNQANGAGGGKSPHNSPRASKNFVGDNKNTIYIFIL